MSGSGKGKASDRFQVRPVISLGDHGGSRAKEPGVGENNSSGLQEDACDEFVGALAVFECEVRGLTKKLADERHLREKAPPTGPQATRVAVGAEAEGSSFSATAASAGVTATRATTSSSFASVTGSSLHRPPPGLSAAAFAAAKGVSDKGAATNSPCDTSCLQAVALNVWATLGFFALPPFGSDLPVGEADGHGRRSLRGDFTGASSPPMGPGEEEEDEKEEKEEEEEEESVFAFVEGLAGYYQRQLAAATAAPGEPQGPLSDDMLRNGLWLVVFNALFYCVSAPGTDFQFTPRGSECLSGDAEDLYAAVDAASSLSSSLEPEGEGAGCKRVPTRLRWGTQATSKAAAGLRPAQKQQQQRTAPGSVFRRRLTPVAVRGSCRHTEPGAGAGEGGKLPFSSSNPAAVLAEAPRKRAEPIERPRRHSAPLVGRLAAPPTIMLWYFVLRTFAQLGYRRDAFYVQTPLHGSIHELLLALLWLTKEHQLVAVAEYVQLQCMYAFLLQQGDPVTHDGNHHPRGHDGIPAADAGGVALEAEYASSAPPHDPDGEALLRCFPAAVPWPPASFLEKEIIAHRLQQIRQILPTSLDERGAPRMHLPDLTRRLLSMRRLIALSMNRLECALHQRTEQTVSLGLHSALDAQLCHPAHHGVYRRLCAGLQHLRGMEARVRETTQQLSQLGSLVARALRLEASSLQQQRLQAAAAKALEDDEMTWQRQPQTAAGKRDGGGRWNLKEAVIRFRATGAREHLTDLWASLRRRAQVGGRLSNAPRGAPRECVAEIAEMQAELEAKVRENMEGLYSLGAALRAELRRWQLCGADTTRHAAAAAAAAGDEDADGGGREETGVASIAAEGSETPLPAALELPNKSGGAHLSNRQRPKKSRPPFMTFDLVTSDIFSRRPQATAVGEPAANATTSARLELERLDEAFLALEQQEECRAKRAEEQRLGEEALGLLRQHGLRVVPRRR
ncbi:uncharacterized protein Tco025E_08766 [Trypanosoma conorhini]|uniref:Tubulin epsilon and delta complex protein 1 domain-containing protein n=1 Tax=Trypanosoma conorhini TaxID=83891 RepID=A0A422N506_9TRYP|nr:uncharacterized protein Tco025E_08766 [Trypanosoma conorhini]RNF00557.1 hypothetical protein Tco025E_08766 [Trypanosoma conorhini]